MSEPISNSGGARAIRDLKALDLIIAKALDLIVASDSDNVDFHLRIPVVDAAGYCLDSVSVSVHPQVLRDTFRVALADSSYDLVLWVAPRDGGFTEFELMAKSDLSEGEYDPV